VQAVTGSLNYVITEQQSTAQTAAAPASTDSLTWTSDRRQSKGFT